MNNTSDPRIFATTWFVSPIQPMMEFKVFYAKLENLLFYTVARRGKSSEPVSLNDGLTGVQSIILSETDEYPDNSSVQFELLQKHLDKKQ